MPDSEVFETAEERWVADRLPARCADCGVTEEDGVDLAEFPRHGDNVAALRAVLGRGTRRRARGAPR